VIGTIGARIGKKIIAEGLTTPPPLEIQCILRKMVKCKVQSVVLEASSHALSQERLGGLDLDAAIFTNLTHEHLDYHYSMQKYLASKQKLFQLLENSSKKTCAIVNADDRFARRVTRGYTGKILTYSVDKMSDFRAHNVKISAERIAFWVKRTVFHSNLPGKYNVYNLLAAALAGWALQINLRTIQAALRKIQAIPGRMEEVLSGRAPLKAGFRVFVDFAHTPDGLTQALGAARMKVKRGGKLILVFGCPGDRDRTKRPVMGKIAAEGADIVIVTTDDPHTEDPVKIIEEILAGWRGIKRNQRLFAEVDRRAAIKKALSLAKPRDVVLVAGRGHEKFQDFNGKRVALDDRDVVKSFLSRKPA
jgi:UDP-N-acetylmuramyl-tripeptide synthetase